MSYTNEELEKEVKYRKIELHIKYITGIAFGCVCVVIILKCCNGQIFQNCISVSSTVVSIVLSVIAIILSVTGERSTNEIRNKIADVIERLSNTAIRTETSNDVFFKKSQQQIEVFEEISIKLEQFVAQIDDIKDNTAKTNTMLDKLMDVNVEREADISNTNADMVCEYISCLRKNYKVGYPRYMIDRTIEYVINVKDDEEMEVDGALYKYIKKHLEKSKSPVDERILLHGTFTAIAVCLYIFDFSDADRKKISEMTMETKELF